MAQYHLSNPVLRLAVNSKGAELYSVFAPEEKLEFIWQAQPDVWARHAPVLFPIVGRLRDNRYTYEGKTYTLPQHGFARDQEFELIEQSATNLKFALRESPQSIENYPFRFRLEVTYGLRGNEVLVNYRVLNPDDQRPLYFSIGAHPGFNCPLLKEERFDDYVINFHRNGLSRTLLKEGLLTSDHEPLATENDTITLTPALFERDAIVLEDRVERVSLLSKKSGHGVSMLAEGYPFFGIWTKPGTQAFVCLEPWQGITDTEDASGELTQKKGILRLEPGEDFSCSYTMMFA